MAYELFLERYNKDFSEQLPVTLEEWKITAEIIEELRYEEHEKSLNAFFEEFNEWYPIFWFSKPTHIHMNARVSSPSWYDFSIKIAEHLKAVIIGEEGEIIYLPTYGGIYDDEYAEPWNLNIKELRGNKILFDENFKDNIDKIIHKSLKKFEHHKKEKLSDAEKAELMKIFYSKPLKKWWQFWK